MSTTNRRRKMKYIISGSIISLILVLVLPLIPYAISASADNDNKQVVNPIEVPSPGADLWRDVRQRDQHVVGTTQVKGVDTGILISKRGESWRQYRMEKLVPYSAYLLGAVVIALLLFRMYRGQIKVESGFSGQKLFRFTFNQRTAHWLVAVLFILLALTGIVLLYGRFVLIPLLGPEGFSVTALVAKRIHDFAGPLFAIALIMLFLAFVKRNLLKKIDLDWFLSAGGIMASKHIGIGYFNAGEKAWFWLSVLGGALIVVTGLVLDFPVLAFARDTLEWSHLLHTIAAMIVVAASLGHIYLGTIGVEGAYEAMATGYCDANWAKEHHDIWYKDMMSGKDPHADIEEGGETQREQPASSG